MQLKIKMVSRMSIGRTSTFLDIYIERDLKEGTLTEKKHKKWIDHFCYEIKNN